MSTAIMHQSFYDIGDYILKVMVDVLFFFFIVRKNFFVWLRVLRPCPTRRTKLVLLLHCYRARFVVVAISPVRFSKNRVKIPVNMPFIVLQPCIFVSKGSRICIGFFSGPSTCWRFSTSQQVEEIFPSHEWVFFSNVSISPQLNRRDFFTDVWFLGIVKFASFGAFFFWNAARSLIHSFRFVFVDKRFHGIFVISNFYSYVISIFFVFHRHGSWVITGQFAFTYFNNPFLNHRNIVECVEKCDCAYFGFREQIRQLFGIYLRAENFPFVICTIDIRHEIY